MYEIHLGEQWGEKTHKQVMLLSECGHLNTVMQRTTTFRSTTGRIYDGRPIRL